MSFKRLSRSASQQYPSFSKPLRTSSTMDYSTISSLEWHLYVHQLHKWFQVFTTLALAIVLFKLIDFLCRVTYRLYLSPLRKFPGPSPAATSNAWEIYHSLTSE